MTKTSTQHKDVKGDPVGGNMFVSAAIFQTEQKDVSNFGADIPDEEGTY